MPRPEVTPPRLLAAAFIFFLSPAAPARAAAPLGVEQAPPRPPIGLELSLGVRAERLGGAGYEAFANDHGMTELALAASYRLAGSPRAGLTAGVEWNHGSTSAEARGSNASLALDRLSLSLRVHRAVRARWIVFGRLAPGLIRARARLAESAASPLYAAYGDGTTMGQTRWVPTVTGALGAAFRVGQLARPREPVYALWLVAEGGYSLARSYQVAVAPTSAPAPALTDQPLALGELTPGGPLFDVVAALTF